VQAEVTRLAWAIAAAGTIVAAGGCGQKPVRGAARDAVAAADAGVTAGAAAVDAATPDAPDAAPPITLDEFLGLAGAEPPVTLGGYTLGAAPGAPRPGGAYARKVEMTGWEAEVIATVVDDTVAQVTVELHPDVGRGIQTTDDFMATVDAQDRAIDEAKRTAAARWKTQVTWHGRTGFRGPASQMFFATYSGFLRGTPSLVVDLLPAGDDVVCGPRDGFAAFLKTFDRAIAAKSLAALDAVLDRHTDEAEEGDELVGCTDDATAVGCVAALRREMKADGARPFCNISVRTYFLQTVEEFHGGTFFRFTRDAAGAWKAHGPYGIGHDTNPSATSPHGW
jgi:hypothetical protein